MPWEFIELRKGGGCIYGSIQSGPHLRIWGTNNAWAKGPHLGVWGVNVGRGHDTGQAAIGESGSETPHLC